MFNIKQLLFLDIDGVLVLKDWGTPSWSAPCCNALKILSDSVPNLKIVISSAWRHNPMQIYYLMSMLQEWSIKSEVIGMTSEIGLFKRDVEIIEYLNKLAQARLMLSVNEYVTDWIVIDDAPEFFNNNVINSKNLMFVDRTKGFTEEHAQYLIKRFTEVKDGI